ncbi:hypothetical protein B0A50_03767 [Salinomyces thailandicus]|uniref:Utp8 beta-propeller domain-containing protein n=1 Tax=Salinomyces thailandicus TaxID=706561 RepID=A0A4U0U300_9PEZI|nr:hypothetical protein B0A50_03767 [Salinomyces thailandica]
MEAPYTIASLPTPSDTKHGKVWAAPVSGIRESKKRKRHEVAVGVDGEGVNIYNIQSQNQVASYALPPQQYLCCPPCSVYVKSGSNQAQRRTYLVTRDGSQDRKRRLLCIVEDARTPRRVDELSLAPTKQQRSLHSRQVAGIEAVALPGVERVLVCYKDGSVECIKCDLSATIWHHNPKPSALEHIEYTTFTDIESAKKGLLVSREDVTALLDSTVTGSPIPAQQPLCCQLIRAESGRYLRLSSMRLGSQDAVQSRAVGLQLLTEMELPESNKALDQVADYDLHAASGKLFQLLQGHLRVLDLTTTMPRVAARFGSQQDPILSFTRVSAYSVLAVFGSRVEVCETKYGSVQATAPLQGSSAIVKSSGRKRKVDEDAHPSWAAISSFSELGIVVGLAGNELCGMQLADHAGSPKRAKGSGTMLADVLGKSFVNFLSTSAGSQQLADLHDWKATVDSALQGSKKKTIESVVPKALNLELGEHQELIPSATSDTVPRKALYILSKCFRMDQRGGSAARKGDVKLTTTAVTAKVYQWLALAGHLSLPAVQQALLLRTDSMTEAHNLRAGDIMAALSSFDDFQLVHDLLSLPVNWELAEVVQALQLLIQSFGTTADSNTSVKALPASNLGENGDTAVPNGVPDETEVESELLAAERDLDSAVMAVSSGLETRSATMRLVIQRLHAFPPRDVSNLMRSMMRHEQLLFFMKILRIELLEGGWPNRYIDLGDEEQDVAGMDGTEESAARPSNHAVGTISDMMNCAIDAIGTSGWLVGQSSDVYGTAELIDALKSEVSAALEGLYEADTVAIFLHGLQGFEKSWEKSLPGVERRKRARGELRDEDVEPEAAVLPMGCKAEPGVVKTRATRDGKKSKRVYEEERRRRVGLYSVDRIRV